MAADGFHIRGWIRNTPDKTVEGIIEGESSNIDKMKRWLADVGSPSSKIEKAQFTNEKSVENYSFENFTIRH